MIGTLAYMSPEQIAGDSQAVDTRSDIYAMGVLLVQLLSEYLPYQGGDVPPRPASSPNSAKGDPPPIRFR